MGCFSLGHQTLILKSIAKILLLLTLSFSFALCDEFEDFELEFQKKEVYDPLKSYNEAMTKFNIAFYSYVIRPVSKGYAFVVPESARNGLRNFFSNLAMPLRFSGNLLQFKFKESGVELLRFTVNTFFGFFGFNDTASASGIAKYDSDFGVALAHWGIGGGFHFVLPILGPSNLRDTLSLPVNWYLNPTGYLEPFWLSLSVNSFAIMNTMSLESDTIDEIYFNTPNVYPFLRDAYEARRIELSK